MAVSRAAPTPATAAPVAAPAPARASPVASAGPRLNLGGGAPIPTPTRRRLESSLGANLSGVRVHAGPAAATAARNLGARAFAFGPQIVLGSGQRADDLALMGHEAAHVLQQQDAPTPQRLAAGGAPFRGGLAGLPAVLLGGAPPGVPRHSGGVLQRWTPAGSDRFEGEANRAAAAVVRGESFAVTERTAGPRVQRLGIGDVLDYFADKANNIPGYRMFTIVLGVNPINMSSVDRGAANILRAVIEFIPGGNLITQALDNHGIIDKVANWVSEQIKSLGMVGGAIKDAVMEFLDSLGWRDIFHLGDVWDRAKRIFTVPIDRIIAFAKNLITGIIKFIKDAILLPLAKLAEGTRAWDLLIAVLGKNPITDEAVPRTPETLIAGFLKLIGQQEVWENMKKANALGRAWAWFQSALGGLIALVSGLPGRAIAAFQSLELVDIVVLPRAFIKIGAVFGGFVLDFLTWGGNAVWNLLEIVFDVVSPGAFGYIKRTGAALKSILKNPLPFVGNLVKAALLGFNNFTKKFGKYLQAGLIDWLTGSLPGIYIPKAFSFPEIVKFALSVLGLSWANVRGKLVKATSETAVKAMEVGFDIVKTLVKDGPAAAWDQIKTQLGDLQKMVVDGITDLVVDAVVTKGIPKLLAMFIPGAGFIPLIISIYDIVMVFVRKLDEIRRVVKSFVDSIVEIAAGNIAGAGDRVEAALAGLLKLAINFLAGFAGLGKIADKLKGVFDKVRAPIDKALDWLVGWIVKQGRAFLSHALGGDPNAPPQQRLERAAAEAQTFANRFAGRRLGAFVLRPGLAAIKARHRLRALEAVPQGQRWAVRCEVNPVLVVTTQVIVLDSSAEAAQLFGQLATAVEQEYFPALNGRLAREMAAGGPVQLQGRSSADVIQARRAVAQERARSGQPPERGRVSERVGNVNVSGMRNPTGAQPQNIFLSWLGSYGQAAPADILPRINELRGAGMSDANISVALQEISTTGQPPTPERLAQFGYRGAPGRIPVMTNFLVRLNRLVYQVEPLRFMDRGIMEGGAGFTRQPVALTTAMGQQLVQGGALGPRGLDQVVGENARLNPVAQGALPGAPAETIARSQVRITDLVERVRQEWSRWRVQTDQTILARVRQLRPDVDPASLHLVPTRAEMLRILEQFYGQSVRITPGR